ncbi:MAG: hypothetical protein P8Z42_00815 [Anaerolineales bacterium]|jgi:hypothetical protein
MDSKRRNNIILGAILVVLGIVLMAAKLLKDESDAAILLLIGGAFFAWYIQKRAYALLIPSCILLGLGLGRIVATAFNISGGMEEIGLGVGFSAIYIIDLILHRKASWWPLIPGAILLIIGLTEVSKAAEDLFAVGWPLIIIVIGAVVLLNALGVFGRKQMEEAPPEDEIEES